MNQSFSHIPSSATIPLRIQPHGQIWCAAYEQCNMPCRYQPPDDIPDNHYLPFADLPAAYLCPFSPSRSRA